MLAETATALSPKLARSAFSKFVQLMVGTCFVACLCQSDLPELVAPSREKSDPNVEVGSSADFSWAPVTWTGRVAACAAAGASRKAELATAIEATTLARKDIGGPLFLRRPGQPLWLLPPRSQSIILADISALPRMSLSCDMSNY